jgi:hypothetical protein
MFTLAEARIAMKAELQDDANFIKPPELDTHIKRAIRQVNLDKPLKLVSDIPGNGTKDLELPAEFLRAFSVIETVEFMSSGVASIPHHYLLPQEDWFVYEDPSLPAAEQMRLQFILSHPRAVDVLRVCHTGTYTVTEDASNLDPYGFEAIIAGGLKFAYTALAAKFSQSTDPTIAADAVNYAGRVQSFLFLRERADKEYKDRTGTNKGIKAAQYLTEIDIVWSTGEDFVWHPRIVR